MSRISLLSTTALTVALTASACSVIDASITTEPLSLMETTAMATLGASEDVVIRVRPVATIEVPQRATLQIPSDLDGSSPVVVLLHGAANSRQDVAPMADAVANMGIPVLNASWSFDVKNPAGTGADAVCAVSYAYNNASSWGADPERIIVMGHSGGGHLGMLAALAPEAFPECATASDSNVWAYIGLAGDPATAAPGGNARKFFADDPELLELMDNYTHVGGNPDLIARFVHGTADLTVPIEQTRAFHDALTAAGYDSKLIAVTGADHFDPANPTTEAGQAALDELVTLVEPLIP